MARSASIAFTAMQVESVAQQLSRTFRASGTLATHWHRVTLVHKRHDMNSPDNSDTELLAALRLNLIPGIGPRTQQTLLARFGTHAAVFAANGH